MRTKIIKIISVIAFVIGIIFATALDSGSWVPIIVTGICFTWTLLVTIANVPTNRD